MPPEEISKDPEKKQLGQSSRHLKLSDFELMRTLGTRFWRLPAQICELTTPGQGPERLLECGCAALPILTRKTETRSSH